MFDRATIAKIAGKVLQGCEQATRWNDRVGRKKLNEFIKGDENKSRDAYIYNEKERSEREGK